MVEKITVEQTSEYFFSRPKGSQLAAIASKQSSVLTSRKELVERFESLQKEYEDKNIPLPDFWGGYRVIPSEIEFWQGGANRLHDRFRYLRNEGGWVIDRLAP